MIRVTTNLAVCILLVGLVGAQDDYPSAMKTLVSSKNLDQEVVQVSRSSKDKFADVPEEVWKAIDDMLMPFGFASSFTSSSPGASDTPAQKHSDSPTIEPTIDNHNQSNESPSLLDRCVCNNSTKSEQPVKKVEPLVQESLVNESGKKLRVITITLPVEETTSPVKPEENLVLSEDSKEENTEKLEGDQVNQTLNESKETKRTTTKKETITKGKSEKKRSKRDAKGGSSKTKNSSKKVKGGEKKSKNNKNRK